MMIGRDKESTILKTLLELKCNVLVEGGVGIGKTTLILENLSSLKKKFIKIDGDARYTEDKLVGWFEPSLVLKKGFNKESFVAGPLVECMQEGKILFINELNRMPEGVQNLLLPALDEMQIQVPHIGTIKAKAGFQVIGTQNSDEFVATSDLSEALKDRFEYLALTPLSFKQTLEIILNDLKKIHPSTQKLLEDFYRFSEANPKISNFRSLRIALSLAKLHENLMTKFRGEDLVREVLTITLKNRLALSADYSFSQFLDDWFKKKV